MLMMSFQPEAITGVVKNTMSSNLITEYHYYKTLSSGILKPVIIMTTKTNKEKNFFEVTFEPF
jgi:hypothetical protein